MPCGHRPLSGRGSPFHSLDGTDGERYGEDGALHEERAGLERNNEPRARSHTRLPIRLQLVPASTCGSCVRVTVRVETNNMSAVRNAGDVPRYRRRSPRTWRFYSQAMPSVRLELKTFGLTVPSNRAIDDDTYSAALGRAPISARHRERYASQTAPRCHE